MPRRKRFSRSYGDPWVSHSINPLCDAKFKHSGFAPLSILTNEHGVGRPNLAGFVLDNLRFDLQANRRGQYKIEMRDVELVFLHAIGAASYNRPPLLAIFI